MPRRQNRPTSHPFDRRPDVELDAIVTGPYSEIMDGHDVHNGRRIPHLPASMQNKNGRWLAANKPCEEEIGGIYVCREFDVRKDDSDQQS